MMMMMMISSFLTIYAFMHQFHRHNHDLAKCRHRVRQHQAHHSNEYPLRPFQIFISMINRRRCVNHRRRRHFIRIDTDNTAVAAMSVITMTAVN